MGRIGSDKTGGRDIGAEARLTLTEAQLAVAALDALAGPGAVAGGQALVAICESHGLEDAVGVLDTWLDARG